MAARDSRSSRDRHFQRRLKAAIAGQHLPTEVELLRGMAFFKADMAVDIREFAERLSRRLKHQPRFEIAPLAAALDDLAVDQSEEAVRCVDSALEAASAFNDTAAYAARLRVRFYLASFGNSDAAAVIAGETASIAFTDVRDNRDFDLVPRALAWAVVANNLGNMRRAGFTSWSRGRVSRDLRSYAEEFEAVLELPEREAKRAEDKNSSDAEKTVARENAQQTDLSKGAVVVFRAIGNDSTSEGKRVGKEFEKLLKVPLPLPPVPDLTRVRKRLADEFPYAVAVIDDLLKRLVGRKHVHFRPTVLVGKPGCGKTRLVRRLCEELALRFELVSCGGLSDSAIGGTPRRWSSGEPSIAVLAVRRHHTAGPVVVLDEIEKVGTSRYNGAVHDVLVGLFEQETSSRWFDPYVQSACDLSHISWLMTANTTATVSPVLLDRCRVIMFPEPGPDQLDVLAPRILERLYVDAGHDARWAAALEHYELAALGEHWRGGSIRKLQQLLEALVEARERHGPRQ